MDTLSSTGIQSLRSMNSLQVPRSVHSSRDYALSEKLHLETDAVNDAVLWERDFQQSNHAVPNADMLPVTSAGFRPDPSTMQELKNIAYRVGYVGLTETSVQRAMAFGESLLADYHV